MGDGNSDRVTAGDVHVQSVTCDVGLGLNSDCKKTGYSYLSNLSPYHHRQYVQASAGGVMGASGKVLFTATQWEELERQKKIYMYIMAAIPVPPQLLSTLSVQSNRLSTGLRFSNGSDPEPWRCRRTDGKKWRCSKDVAPDQKYCERHVHKTRSRSRKPVEPQSQNTIASTPNQQTRSIKNSSIPVSQSINRTDPISKQDFKGIQSQNCYVDLDNRSYLNGIGTDWARIRGGDECSLSLSTRSGANDVEFDDESFQMAVGMLRGDRDVLKPDYQWLNRGSWVGSGLAPGGPLGEALCLGMAGGQSDSYSRGYSYSTTTSGSCDGGGGGYGLDFGNPRDD